MVVCLLWDAINDPMMGIIIENSHLKAGKFKPWIFIGVILNSLIIICLFTVRSEGWGFVAFFGVGYLLWGMTYTMNDIAYWGMLPSLTSDPGERNWLVNNTVFTVMPGTSKLEKADFPVHVTVRKYDTRIIDDTTRLLL